MRLFNKGSQKRGLTFLLLLVGLSTPSHALAQKIITIGSLNTADQFVNAFEGFKARMAEFGYEENQNIRYQYYNSRGSNEALKVFAQKLVQEKVDMIVTSSTTATVAAATATRGTPIPVVFLSAGNAQRLVKNFFSSGSNLTGISSASLELTGKRLELLKELAPWVQKVALPADVSGVNYQAIVQETRAAARRLNLTISEVKISSREDVEKSALLLRRNSIDAIFTPPDSLVTEAIDIFIRQASQEKVPLVTSLLVNVKRGCLATYAADYAALGKQGAVLADKILRGTKPSDLPIELPYKLNLAINLKTARAIELSIPKAILLRADEVFE